MATGWKLEIGPHGALTDYSGGTSGYQADFASFRGFLSLRHRGGQASVRITVSQQAVLRPKCFHEFKLTNLNTGTVLFGGVVQRVTQEMVNPLVAEYLVEASDYTRWLDHLPAGAKSYSGKVSDIAVALVTDWVTRTADVAQLAMGVGPSVPVTTAGVQPVNVTYTGYNPNYVPVSQAIDYLAKLADAVWYVDENRDLKFFNPDSNPTYAPVPTNQGVEPLSFYNQDPVNPATVTYSGSGPATSIPTIYADTANLDPTQGRSIYFDLVLVEDASTAVSGATALDYLDITTSRGSEGTGGGAGTNPNAKLVGDGSTKFFPLYNQPVDPAHTQVTVTPPGTVYNTAGGNMKTEYVDGQPGDAAQQAGTPDYCFVCSSNYGIRFNVAPANGATILVSYQWYFGPTQSQTQGRGATTALGLPAIIKAREGFGPGLYWATISDAALTSTIALTDPGITAWQAAMQLMLIRYAHIKVNASFSSRLTGWRPGQLLAIVSNFRGDKNSVDPNDALYTGWGARFAQRFFITQCEYTLENDASILTKVEASSHIWGD